MSTNWVFGADNATNSYPYCAGMKFYIGRLGGGTTPSQLWTLPAGANIPAYTYWNIEGPGANPDPTSITNTQWGEQQANAYYNYWHTVASPTGFVGNTMFGAVSSGSGGWNAKQTATAYQENQAVADGFLNGLQSVLNANDFAVNIGLYGSQTSEFADLLDASNWSSPQPIVIWNAIGTSKSYSDCTGIESVYCPAPNIGGYAVVIWQFATNVTGPDYDVSPYGTEGTIDMQWPSVKYPGFC